MPGNLQVRCQPSFETTVAEITTETHFAANDSVISDFLEEENLHVPNCDYETPVPYAAIEKAPGAGWAVLDWSFFRSGPNASWSTGWDFGVRDAFANVSFFLDLSLNETELALHREDWRYGRRVRDGLSLIMGVDIPFYNETTNKYRLDKLPHGVEFKVEYSVITGPFVSNIGPYASEQKHYTLSSWSHSCPFIDSSGDLSATVFPIEDAEVHLLSNEKASASGCLIDTLLGCDTTFAQDDPNYRNVTAEETPSCPINNIKVTLLSGIEVDPGMLAAYAGIASRNDDYENDATSPGYHHVSLNSIAAAYIMTRELVRGTVVVQGVRASIDPFYVFFMILPLLFALPLVFLTKNGPPPPVPKSIFDVMVFGRGEETVPDRRDSGSPFPPCPNNLKFGVTLDESSEFIHVGLGKTFVPLDRPLSERKTKTPTESVPEENISV